MPNYIRAIIVFFVCIFSLGVCHAKSRRPKAKVYRHQMAPEPGRIREIQTALSRQGYRGEWKEAMRKFQRDHNWQVKMVPDSRALIVLGLGPKYKDVINPKTAWTSQQYALASAR